MIENIIPPEEGRDPTPFEDEVLGALEDMDAASAEIERCTRCLAAAFLKILEPKLATGLQVDTRDPDSPAFLAKVMRGRHHNNTPLFVIRSVRVEISVSHPLLSQWIAKAVCMRERHGSAYSGEVELKGDVFPRALRAKPPQSGGPHDEIVREVTRFESCERSGDLGQQ